VGTPSKFIHPVIAYGRNMQSPQGWIFFQEELHASPQAIVLAIPYGWSAVPVVAAVVFANRIGQLCKFNFRSPRDSRQIPVLHGMEHSAAAARGNGFPSAKKYFPAPRFFAKFA
jgi:hypothetical protein